MRNLFLLLVLITVACGGKSGLDCNCPDCETCEECEPTLPWACEETCECPYGFQAQCHTETETCRCIEEELECWDITRAEFAHVVMKPLIDLNSFEPVGPTYPDVPESHQYFKAIHAAAEYGWFVGFPDGDFRPSDGVNKADAAKVVFLAYNLPFTTDSPTTPDISESDWFYEYVGSLLENDLVRLRLDGTYAPGEPATTCFADLAVANAQLYNLDHPTPLD